MASTDVATSADTDAGPAAYPFLKGHGTENDFVVLPDPDGTVHGDLAEKRVRALCDRRAGLGADGVLRVVRAHPGSGADWFMDYRNADGSVAEMCGNGIRLFARFLVQEGWAEAPGAGRPLLVDTRDGVKALTLDGDQVTVDMGRPHDLGTTTVSVGEVSWPARHVDLGNPHAVAFVGDLADAGPLLEPPTYDDGVYPHGVNVEFVVTRGERHMAMRVHERGSGETRSCGTGACAVMVAAALADGHAPGGRTTGEDLAYRVDVPGGTLVATWTADDRVLLTGPAVLVARGTTSL